MPTHACKRCGYTSPLKANLRLHLERMNPCQPTLADIPPADLLAEVASSIRRRHTPEHTELRNYKEEDLTHLLGDMDYMRRAVHAMGQGCIQFIQDAFCDPLHPENQTVRIGSTRKRTLEVRVNGRWLEHYRTNFMPTMPTLVKRVVMLMKQHFVVHGGGALEASETEMRAIQKWIVDSLPKDDAERTPLSFTRMSAHAYDVFLAADKKHRAP